MYVWIWEQTAIISLYSINWLVCITETECVYCAVRTGSLYIILRSVHTVCLCVLCGSENKQRLFPYTALTDWSVRITETERVYCAVRAECLYTMRVNFRISRIKISPSHLFTFQSFSPRAVSNGTVNNMLLKHEYLPGRIRELIWLRVQIWDIPFSNNQPGNRSDPLRRNLTWRLLFQHRISKRAHKTYVLISGTEQNQHSKPHYVPSFDLLTQIDSSWQYDADKHEVMDVPSYS